MSKCQAKVNGRRCKRDRVSGRNIFFDGLWYEVCTQHYRVNQTHPITEFVGEGQKPVVLKTEDDNMMGVAIQPPLSVDLIISGITNKEEVMPYINQPTQATLDDNNPALNNFGAQNVTCACCGKHVYNTENNAVVCDCITGLCPNCDKKEEVLDEHTSKEKGGKFMFKCGRCKLYHDSARRVAECYNVVPLRQSQAENKAKFEVTKTDDGVRTADDGSKRYFGTKGMVWAKLDELKKKGVNIASYKITAIKTGDHMLVWTEQS